MDSYCLFCRTGSEKTLAQAVQQSFPDIIALAPVKLLPEKRQKIWSDREIVLLPGYVFVYCEGDLPGELRHKVRDLYKILEYEYGVRKLNDSDAVYADWLLRHSGRIQPSRVLTIGGRVQVADGPLKDCAGTVVRLDKHKRRAWVEFTFDGHTRVVSLGAEWIASADAPQPEELGSEPEATGPADPPTS